MTKNKLDCIAYCISVVIESLKIVGATKKQCLF